MATRLLIDTDVLIDDLRDYPDAVSYVEAQPERLLISVVTVAELYAGVREGEERSRLERFLRAFEIIPLDQGLAVQGGLYRRDYHKSHNVGLADALIAATAMRRAGPPGDAQPEAFSHAPGRDCAVPRGAAQPRT
jgi:predicted nucleic acid-binding protein